MNASGPRCSTPWVHALAAPPIDEPQHKVDKATAVVVPMHAVGMPLTGSNSGNPWPSSQVTP